ncbi:MAG: septum formation protein Maf [Calditrichia bacterium]|nr:septum formation protein Maf [Calditrichia bacterium]
MLALLKNIDQFKIILASQSPRRLELLKMIGLDFEVKPSNIIEKNHNSLQPLDYALMNAKEKARVVSEKYPNSVVISADTIVVLGNQILEKPENDNHAFEILKQLNGKTHEVITAFGVILKSKEISKFDSERTKVKFRKLPHDKIKAYVKTSEPLDKAGGYGAQGLGSLLIEKVDGCFYNVVGFPLGKFYLMLEEILNEL